MPTVRFFIDAIFLGVALSMDAFSISVANGLCNQNMSRSQAILIPSTFAFFQLLMPLVGWICVKTVVSVFEKLEHLVPIIAMIVLAALGIKMLIESFSQKLETCDVVRLDTKELLIQGIATSLDALSVGFTIAEYSFVLACAGNGIRSRYRSGNVCNLRTRCETGKTGRLPFFKVRDLFGRKYFNYNRC